MYSLITLFLYSDATIRICLTEKFDRVRMAINVFFCFCFLFTKQIHRSKTVKTVLKCYGKLNIRSSQHVTFRVEKQKKKGGGWCLLEVTSRLQYVQLIVSILQTCASQNTHDIRGLLHQFAARYPELQKLKCLALLD